MAETRRKFDQDFKEGAVRLVRETSRPVAQVTNDAGGRRGAAGRVRRVEIARPDADAADAPVRLAGLLRGQHSGLPPERAA
jgi:transposase